MKIEDVCAPGEIIPQSRIVLGIQLIAAMAVLAGVVLWGAWPLLWCLVTVFPITVVCNMVRYFYWRGFDPFIWRAAESGRYKTMLGWNVLTILLDWMLNVVPLTAGAYIIFALVGGSAIPRVFAWLALLFCIYPLRFKVQRSHRFKDDRFSAALFVLTLGLAAASFLFVTTPRQATAIGLLFTVFIVPLEVIIQMPRIKREYEQMLGDASRGVVRRPTWSSSWFPRKGVVFEPQYNSYTKVNVSMFMEIQPMMTVLRVNWCGAILSLGLLAFGLVRVIDAGRSALILLVPVLALFGLVHGMFTSSLDRAVQEKGERIDALRGGFIAFSMTILGVCVLWWGGREIGSLISLAALFGAAWYVFPGFVVRGTSHGVFDTLEFVLALVALAAVVAARVFLGCVWWEALLPIGFFAFVYPYLRSWKPRTDLPEVKEPEKAEGAPKGGANATEKKNRRARKRERQMGAFRRSQGRGAAE